MTVSAALTDLPAPLDAGDAGWLTLEQFAGLLGVSERTAGRLCAAGVPSLRVFTTWRVWGPFAAALLRHMVTTGSVDVLEFTSAWRAGGTPVSTCPDCCTQYTGGIHACRRSSQTITTLPLAAREVTTAAGPAGTREGAPGPAAPTPSPSRLAAPAVPCESPHPRRPGGPDGGERS